MSEPEFELIYQDGTLTVEKFVDCHRTKICRGKVRGEECIVSLRNYTLEEAIEKFKEHFGEYDKA